MWPLPWRGALGARGERLAARYLRRRGYRILARSYRCPLGELDLVAALDRVIVFVEVKTRSAAEPVEPWEAVDRRKQQRLTRLAAGFLKSRELADRQARFDVIAITWPAGWLVRPRIEHFESAFDAVGPWSV